MSLPTFTYETRSQFVADVSDASSSVSAAPGGSVAHAEGLLYRRVPGSSVIPDLSGWVPYKAVWIEHFGATVTQTTVHANADTADNVPMFNSAFEYLKQGGELRLSDGYYRLASTLKIPYDGIQLIGNGERSTYLFADHADGPLLHVMNEGCDISRLACLPSASRKESTNPLCVGILFQIEDVPKSNLLKNSHMQNVRVLKQPSHGIVINNSFTGAFDRIWVMENRGHGIVVDRADVYPMQHPEGVPGICDFNHCQVVRNSGHAFAFGHPDNEITTQALRINVNNCEIGKNATDPDVRYVHAQVYCRAVEIRFISNVFKSADGTATTGIYAAGRCIMIENNRFIGVEHAVMIGSYDSFPTIGVYITGFDLIVSPVYSAVRVVKTPGQNSEPEGIYVNNYNFRAGVDTLLDSEDGGAWRVPRGSIGGNMLSVYKKEDQSVVNSNDMINDEHLRFWVVPGETVRFTVNIEFSGPPVSDFRCTIRAPNTSKCRFAPESGVTIDSVQKVELVPVTNAGQNVSVGTGGVDQRRLLTLRGFITNGIHAGEVKLAWRPIRESPEPTTVHAGLSAIDLIRVVP